MSAFGPFRLVFPMTRRAGNVVVPSGTSRKGDTAEACMAALFAIAMDPKESGSTRVAAITRILDREIGKPVQPNLSLNKDDVAALSDDELRNEIARLDREAAAAEARGSPAATET